MIDAKHIAPFLLGVAAGLAAHKYITMTDEEKQVMAEKLKAKAQELQTDAEQAAAKAKDYFNDLKNKGADALKEHLPQAEELLKSLFGNTTKTETPPTA